MCYKNDCQTIDLSIAEEKDIELSINNLKLGKQSITIEANNENVKVSDILPIEIIENPGVKILSANYPESLKYQDNFDIKLSLSTRIPIQNVKVIINGKEVAQIQKILSTQQIVISSSGKNFLDKKEIKIGLNFEDGNNQTYKSESSYPISVTNIPWYIKILHFLNLI